MRGAFVRTLVELAETDPRILLLTGDLGYMALEPFADRFPDRFLNVGVAEQNMVGIATGLAEAGFVPFVYSIATFATLRPYEFIRNGPVWHHLPVRIVGIGGGFEYGTQGTSHHALEDVAVLRPQPGLTIVAPADHVQAVSAVRATYALPGPVYYRLGKDDRTVVPGLDGRYALDRVERIREGSDVVLVTGGSVTGEVVAAADALATHGIGARIVIVSTLSPTPVASLAEALAGPSVVCTVEAHYVTGGLGSLVAEVLAERGDGARLVRCGVRERPDGRSGSQAWLHARHGIGAAGVTATVRQALGR